MAHPWKEQWTQPLPPPEKKAASKRQKKVMTTDGKVETK